MSPRPSLRQAVRIALATAAAAGEAGALYAQEPPAAIPGTASPQEILVTGTRLSTPDEVSISPITSVSATEILQTGLTRVEDVLDQLPMVFPSQNSTVSNGADGTATVDLRGLGTARTLVLVDGLRLGPGSSDGRNSSDINQIPVALIERIDVLTGSASTVYGADAVAGVVNFILNTHFEGVRVDAGYHFDSHNNHDQAGVASLVTAAGDPLPPRSVNTGFGKNVAILMGSNFADTRGNATAYVTYDNQSATLQSKFDYSACSLSPVPENPPFTSLACGGSPVSRGGEFLALIGSSFLVNHTVDPKTGVFRLFAVPQDLYNFGAANYYLVPNERWTAGGFLHYELSSHAEVYLNVMFMRNSMRAQIAPSGDFFKASFIPCADPLLTAQELSTLCTPGNLAANGGNYEVYDGKTYPGLNMFIARRSVEGGNRIVNFANDAAREVVGIKGDFAGAWTYDVHAQNGTVDIADESENFLGNFQLQQALNVLPGPNGPICGGPTGNASALVSPGTQFAPNPKCVPWNIWVPNGVTPETLAFMTTPLQITGSVTEQVVSGSVTGDLGRYGARLPWVEQGLQVNAGFEWREERSDYQPDFQQQQGNVGGGGPVPPVAGEFSVREIFSEMRLPLAANRTFADDLSLEGGYRYSSYSDGFNTHTYKLGLQWAPVRDLRVRSSYQRAVRAPNISELFYPQSVGAGGSIDPCAGPTPTAALAACELTGVTRHQYGHILGNPPTGSYNGFVGGNPALQPETADTYTIGLVLQPRNLQNLRLSIDYFNIKLDGAIQPIGADTIMRDCLASVGNPGQAARFCPLIHRDSLGSLWLSPAAYISDLRVNAGELATAGIDINGSYQVALPVGGSLLFSLVGTYLKSLQTTPVAGFGSYDCVGYFGATCTVAPKWRSLFNATWSTPWQGLDLNLRWRYIGSAESDQTSANPFLAGAPYLPLAHIPAYNYFDLMGSVSLYKSVRLQLGINNIADKTPPLVVGNDCFTGSGCNGNTFPGVYDALGRYVFAHISAQW